MASPGPDHRFSKPHPARSTRETLGLDRSHKDGHDAIREKGPPVVLWCGVLGEQYGSAIESQFARDLPEVVAWALADGPTPQTVQDCNFVTERLMSLRSRLSAAYKGLHALIMQKGGAADWRTGARTDEQTYFDESIDIHHIFPRAWCDRQKIDAGIYNSILNKTALAARTNRFLGGDAPTVYLRRLQERRQMEPDRIDGFLRTHFIEPQMLRNDNFRGMMTSRAEVLCAEIGEATGRPVAGPKISELIYTGRLSDLTGIGVQCKYGRGVLPADRIEELRNGELLCERACSGYLDRSPTHCLDNDFVPTR